MNFNKSTIFCAVVVGLVFVADSQSSLLDSITDAISDAAKNAIDQLDKLDFTQFLSSKLTCTVDKSLQHAL